MNRERCINLDWLEVYVMEPTDQYPMNAEFWRSHNVPVRERAYGTRQYKEMLFIDDEHGEPFLEIRREPHSTTARDGGFFPPESCHIRLTNNTCYREDAISALRDFLNRWNYSFGKIFRVDVALDFEKFDFGDDPAEFIRRYMKGLYSKLNQSNISAHGTDWWNGRVWNSLAWGKPTSMVSTKMYCKTLELGSPKTKPYIWWTWFQKGLIDDPTSGDKRGADGKAYKPVIWRVEFSIKSKARKWVTIETETGKKSPIYVPNSLELYDTQERRLIIFASLAQHYFRFKKYKEGVRKDRCEDKRLFDFSVNDHFMKINQIAKKEVEDTFLSRFLHFLELYSALVYDKTLTDAIQTIFDDVKERQLAKMLNRETDYVQIQAIRALIRERLEGDTTQPIAKHYRELYELFSQDNPIF